MKKPLIPVLFLVSAVSTVCAQSWMWDKAITGGKGLFDAITMSTDPSGNIYLSSTYTDSVSFLSKYLYSPDESNNPGLAKYDKNGILQWVTGCSANGSADDFPFASATDNAGNTYQAGVFQDSMHIQGGNYLKALSDMFVIKYSTNGGLLWYYKAGLGKTSSAYVEAMTLDKHANIYVAGKFTDTLIMGNDTLKDGKYFGNIFVAKLDSSGNFLWLKEGIVKKGAETMGGLAIQADPFGNEYLYGTFYDSIQFDSYKLWTGYSNPNLFFIKYDSNGNIKWVQTPLLISPSAFVNNNKSGYSPQMAIDNTGNIYLGNSYFGTVQFGISILNSPYWSNYFIAKYDTSGKALWAKNAVYSPDSKSLIVPNYLSADSLGHLYISGYVTDTGYINGTLITCDSTTAPAFIAKMDTACNVICSTIVTNNNDDFSPVIPDPLGDDAIFGADAEVGSTYCYFGSDLVLSPGAKSEWGILGKWKCLPLATEEQKKPLSITLYPNPNNGAFMLQVNSEQLKVNSVVEIYNALGQQVYNGRLTMNNGQCKIDLSTQANGVYLYRIVTTSGKQLADGKFIINK